MVSAQILLQLLRGAFQLIATTLNPTGYLFPSSSVVEDCKSYDYIVVGGGTAGCIVASRLAEDGRTSVLLIEAGGDPPLESLLSAFFSLLPRSINDWSYESVPNQNIAQNTVKRRMELTAGKMLGGSTGLSHHLIVRSHPQEYDNWSDIINNTAWNFENLLPFLKKPEDLSVVEVLESEYGKYYGTGGNVRITKTSDEIAKEILKAFEEIGPNEAARMKSFGVLGYEEPLVYISDLNGARETTSSTYLPRISIKPNLHVMKNTEVTRIIFDNNKNAVGVIARNKSGEFQINSKKEVIVCAGAFNTPKLLMLSGVGPRNKLENLGIKVISDLPVGENLQDPSTVMIGFKLGASNKTKVPRDPHRYPAPLVFGRDTLNSNNYIPDFSVTCLTFDHDAMEIPLLTSALFNYVEGIGETLFNASKGHELTLIFVTLLRPKTRGRVELASNKYSDNPLIYLNTLSNDEDLTNIARYLRKVMRLRRTEYFQGVDAEFVNLDIGCGMNDNSIDYWKCYARAIGNTCWNYVGTCSLGTVVDADLKVNGVGKLRVIDASVIPLSTSGFSIRPVMGIAEKGADLIKKSCY